MKAKLKKLFRWDVFSVGCILAAVVYAIWKELDFHYGGGLISAFFQGAIVFGGLAIHWAWAKGQR